MPTTPNLLIPIDVPGSTAGAPSYQWATDNESFKSIMDAHSHLGTPGTGLQIVTAAININADLSYNSFNATGFRSIRLVNNAAPLALGTDLGCVYEAAGNLYYNNGTGQQVQITLGAGLNLSGVNGFTGLSGTTAAATYTVGTTTFAFTSAATLSASLDAGNVIIRQPGLASVKGITLQSPASLAANYSLTLPTGLPGSLVNILTLDSTGQIAAGATITAAIPFGTTALGLGLPLQAIAPATATTPGAGGLSLFADSVTGKLHGKTPAGTAYPIYLMIPNTASPASFSTVETIVAGGATGGANAPTINCKLPASALYVGAMVRIRIAGTCTSSAANTWTLKVRVGANGTTADTAVITFPAITAATTGTLQGWTMTISLPVTAIGASALFGLGAGGGCMVELMNGGVTGGIFTAATNQFLNPASSTFNSTLANFITLTLVSSATTTSFPNIYYGTVEIL